MKKVIKEEIGVPEVVGSTEEEVMLDELIAIRDGLTKYQISPDSRLGVLIDQLQKKLGK